MSKKRTPVKECDTTVQRLIEVIAEKLSRNNRGAVRDGE
jgi:hypothetical protein